MANQIHTERITPEMLQTIHQCLMAVPRRVAKRIAEQALITDVNLGLRTPCRFFGPGNDDLLIFKYNFKTDK